MRRVMMLVALVSLLSVTFAGVALARDFQCGENPCEGTSTADRIFERGGRDVPDTISGLGDNDVIRANIFGNDRDRLFGNRGDDRLNANDGDGRDLLAGGAGFDQCFGDVEDDPDTPLVVEPSDTFRSCEAINGVIQ